MQRAAGQGRATAASTRAPAASARPPRRARARRPRPGRPRRAGLAAARSRQRRAEGRPTCSAHLRRWPARAAAVELAAPEVRPGQGSRYGTATRPGSPPATRRRPPHVRSTAPGSPDSSSATRAIPRPSDAIRPLLGARAQLDALPGSRARRPGRRPCTATAARLNKPQATTDRRRDQARGLDRAVEDVAGFGQAPVAIHSAVLARA